MADAARVRFIFRPPAAHPAGLLSLPWDDPLAEWADDRLLEVAHRGISRHVVRFVEVDGMAYALKEIDERLARREYRLLAPAAAPPTATRTPTPEQRCSTAACSQPGRCVELPCGERRSTRALTALREITDPWRPVQGSGKQPSGSRAGVEARP